MVNFMPTTQDRGINGRRNLASTYTDANKGRSRAFKRQSGANHIIRGLKTASPAPNKAIKDTSNPVIPLKCTSSSKDVPVSDYVVQNDIQYAVDGTSKSSQQDQWLLPLLIAVASQGTTLSSLVPQLSSSLGIFSQTMMRSRLPRKKAFIAVKKSTNSFAVWCHTSAIIVLNKPHGIEHITVLLLSVRTFCEQCQGPDLFGKRRLATVSSGEALARWRYSMNLLRLFCLNISSGRQSSMRTRKLGALEAEYPTFLYAMPMTKTSETCLASKDVIMPIDLLKTKLMLRVKSIQDKKSVVPCQKNLTFGAAASMVHPATGYSVVRSLSETP
ncbi:hypothetical protein HID58_003052 [Brassica napus]|uniref:Uncharacterized protein n=1 Tax=Brassica napus TaxID=3708 RepID=A0ABQ8EP02_BRANA|nr:hypothetical protein HID58_003052 [Brassica napus]